MSRHTNLGPYLHAIRVQAAHIIEEATEAVVSHNMGRKEEALRQMDEDVRNHASELVKAVALLRLNIREERSS